MADESTEKEINKLRKDDKFLRSVMGTLAVSLILQGIGWVYMSGKVVNQVEVNKKQTDDNRLAIERLFGMNDRLARMEGKMDTMVYIFNKENKP